MPTVLVELPGGEGVVRSDDGEVVLADDVRNGGGQRLRAEAPYSPGKAWLDRDRSLVGGLLPPGAVSVEVIDHRAARVAASVANGAYAGILEQPIDGEEPVVCCRDAFGTPVRRPLPADYPCEPVTDVQEPCPACGAIDYEECFPTEQWRGGTTGPGGTLIPSPLVVCRVCGHEEREGSIMRISTPDDEDEAARAEREAKWRAEWRVQRWYSNKITLMAVTFPIYAVEGWPAQINGQGSQGDELTELTIAHTDTDDADLAARPRIEITTARDEGFRDELTIARDKLEGWIEMAGEEPGPGSVSNAAFTLWIRARQRRRRAAALAAQATQVEITLDGAPQPFLALMAPSSQWVAARRHDDLMITIAGDGLDPATLTVEPIADPTARLLGPQPPDA